MKKNRKVRKYLGIALLALIAYAVWRCGEAGTATPWTWNRGEEDTKRKGGFQFSFNMGVSTLNFTTQRTATTSSQQNSAIDFSSITVHADSKHPLAIACAEKIAESLKTIPAITRVAFVPHGPIIGKDERLPSQIVQVGVGNLNERVVPNRSLTGNVYISFGTDLVWKPCSYSVVGEGALIQFQSQTTHEVSFTHTGICSQSGFYEKFADDISKNTVKAIKKTIDELSEQSPFLPKLPELFYPAYREPSEIPPIPGLVSKTTLVDGRRFVLPHYSLEQIESDFEGTDDDFLTAVQEAMGKAGWKGEIEKRDGSDTPAYMRLRRDRETFYIFQKKKESRLALQEMIKPDAPVRNGPPHVFLLERTEGMSGDSIVSAMQTLLDENAPAGALLMFEEWQYGNNNLRDQMRAKFLESKTNTPAEQLALAQFFRQIGDKDIAREMLLKAWQVRHLSSTPKPDSNYMTLAKDLGIEKEMEAQPPLTAEHFEEYGFIFLTPEKCPQEIEVGLDKEVRFATLNDEGYLSFMRFAFRHEKGTYHTEGLQKSFMKHGAAWWSPIDETSETFPCISRSFSYGDQGWFSFSVIPESSPFRVKITFRDR